MIRIILFIIACIVVVALVGGNDIDKCVESGRTIDNCFAIYNP